MEKVVIVKRRSGSGPTCAVVGCNNSYLRLKNWRNSECEEHYPTKHDECPCLIPYSLHTFPKEEILRQCWTDALNRKNYTPGRAAMVCSVHFEDKKPTPSNPIPTLKLGYERKVRPVHGDSPPLKRRRRVIVKHLKPELISNDDNMLVERRQVEKLEIPQTLRIESVVCDVGVQCNLCDCRPNGRQSIRLSNSKQPRRMRKILATTVPVTVFNVWQDKEKMHLYTGLSKELVDG